VKRYAHEERLKGANSVQVQMTVLMTELSEKAHELMHMEHTEPKYDEVQRKLLESTR
jgi:hypothetical protein